MSAAPQLESSGVNFGDRQFPTSLPGGSRLRMLHDQILVKPLDILASKIIIVQHHGRPTIRGSIVSVGKGCYPWRYNSDRTKRWLSKAFRGCEVKVGDVAYFGGPAPGEGWPFPLLYIGNELHFICREEDVCGAEVPAEIFHVEHSPCA